MTPVARPELGQAETSHPSSIAVNSLAPVIGQMQLRPKAKPAVLATTPTVTGLLQALKRRWVLALSLATAGAAVAAAIGYFSQPVSYTVRASLEIKPTPPFLLHPIGGVDYVNYKHTQMMHVRSLTVLNKALYKLLPEAPTDPEKFKKWIDGKDQPADKETSAAANPVETKYERLGLIGEEALLAYQRDIIVDFSTGPEIMSIRMTGPEPNELVKLVASVTKAYVDDILNAELAERRDRKKKLEEVKQTYDKKRGDAWQKYVDLGSGSQESKIQSMWVEMKFRQLSAAQSDLLKVQAERLKEQLFLGALELQGEKRKDPDFEQKLLERYLEKDPTYKGIVKQKSDLVRDIERIKSITKNPKKDPSYERYEKQLENIEKELEATREKLLKGKLKDLVASEIHKIQDDSKKHFDELQASEDLYKKEVERLAEGIENIKKYSFLIEKAREEALKYDEIVKRLDAQIAALDVEFTADLPPRWKLLEPPAAVKNTPDRLKKLGMAAGGTFAFFILGISFLEFRKRRVSTVDEIVRGLELRLMGTVPTVPERTQRGLGSASDPRDLYWQGILAESVDAARTMLLHMARQESHKVVMITSAIGGEGKTQLSCHLAASLARAGFRTLLVDCDLRRPAVHQLFGLAKGPGFGELLCEEVKSEKAVQATLVDGLWAMSAGKATPAAFQALAHHKSKEIFASLKEKFDFVLVDSAPVLAVSDSSLIAQGVDGVMLSVLREVSLLPSVFSAYERLVALQVRVLGAVVSGVAGDYYRTRYPSYNNKNSVPEEIPDNEATTSSTP
jgi:polysaccharide biosynthesis transport protein